MDQLESLSHSVWECKYHVAFIPKCRRKVRMKVFGGIWARCSNVWPNRRNVAFWKAT